MLATQQWSKRTNAVIVAKVYLTAIGLCLKLSQAADYGQQQRNVQLHLDCCCRLARQGLHAMHPPCALDGQAQQLQPKIQGTFWVT